MTLSFARVQRAIGLVGKTQRTEYDARLQQDVSRLEDLIVPADRHIVTLDGCARTGADL